MLFGTDPRFALSCGANRSRSHLQRTVAQHSRILALGVLVCTVLCTALAAPSTTVKADDPEPSNLPPEIEDFVGAEDPLGWTFEGRVIDEDPVGMVVTLGGLLDGHQVTVNDADGYFYYSVELGGTGTVTAHTVDDQQQGSNTAIYPVY